jgi:DNA-binding transcriptional LysR family regulator
MPSRIADMDFKLLSVFIAVVRHGGFAAAEDELKIGRPAISRHMSELEARLGFRLCERGRGGFGLTERGRQAYEATLSILSQVEDFRAELASIRHHLTGNLNIGVVDGMILDDSFALPGALADLRRLSGDVHVTIQVMSPHDIERQVDDGRLHLGIIAHHQTIATLEYFPLQRERLPLYCGRSHALFAMPDSEITDNAIQSSAYVRRGFAFLPEARSEAFTGERTATAMQMEGIAFFVLSGEYIGHLPDYYARPWVEAGEMRELGGEAFAHEVQITAVTRQRRHRPLALERFLTSLLGARNQVHEPPHVRRAAP